MVLEPEALSRATNSFSNALNRLSISRSVDEIFLLTIRRNSGGSFVSNYEDVTQSCHTVVLAPSGSDLTSQALHPVKSPYA